MSDTCKARVWSNGDMDSCGNIAARMDRCLACIDHEISVIHKQQIESEQAKIKLQERLAALQGIELPKPLKVLVYPVTLNTYGRVAHVQVLGIYSTPELANARINKIEARCREEEGLFIVVERKDNVVTVSGRNIAFETAVYRIGEPIELDKGLE